jgi:hypothetical protein
MTPKEKAEELRSKFFDKKYEGSWVATVQAKRYAMSVVDEVLTIYYDDSQSMWADELSYWHQVKQEIEKL